MTTKRLQYVPVVREYADLPAPTAFELGAAFYVQDTGLFYETDGDDWIVLEGQEGPAGPTGATGPAGPAGADAPQFRGVAYRTTTGTIDFSGSPSGTFINSGLSGTLDSASPVGTSLSSAGSFGLKRTASGSAWAYVIATADMSPTNKTRFGIKLALNGTPIDATECNATVSNNDVGKLHSMYLMELEQNDEVTVYFANYTDTSSADMERARMVWFGIR